jgi:hypothetical protein
MSAMAAETSTTGVDPLGGFFRLDPHGLPALAVERLYASFSGPVTEEDCGRHCAPFNPSGKPFCCDICQAVPAAYPAEWAYLRRRSDLWRPWRGDECSPVDADALRADVPASMQLLACRGPVHCQREYRLLSCRQFPFFPYVTADGRFIGLTYEWQFAEVCWVISHLEAVRAGFRVDFVRVFDALLAAWPDEFENYATHSAEMRAYFRGLRRRIPILHRRGGLVLLSPGSERMVRGEAAHLPGYGPYYRSPA